MNNSTVDTIKVGIVMGSKSDLVIMQDAASILKHLDVPFEMGVVSAHRAPERMFDYAKTASTRGLKVLIAGASVAGHLPGMLAAITHLPVINGLKKLAMIKLNLMMEQ